MSGEDVRKLQVFFNNHNDQVASSGPGAPQHETSYFGFNTKKAVARFQSTHAKDMNLSVDDLAAGSGLFGPKTRAFVNGMLTNGQ